PSLWRLCSCGARSTECASRAERRSRQGSACPRTSSSSASLDFLLGVLTGAQSLDALIRWGGYTVLFVIVFVETGLFAFLPGDSLLISAGLVAAAGHLNIWWLNVLLCIAAVLGDNVGYAVGARIGSRLFTREKSLLFQPPPAARTPRLYARHRPH